MSEQIVIKSENSGEKQDHHPGDCRFLDGRGLNGEPGTEVLRIVGQTGEFLVRGVPEKDPKRIIAALREWTTRALDAKSPATLDLEESHPRDLKTLPKEGFVNITTGRGAGKYEREPSNIRIAEGGDVTVNGVFVENDEKLRKNLRAVLRAADAEWLPATSP